MNVSLGDAIKDLVSNLKSPTGGDKDGKFSITLAQATIDKQTKRITKTTVQASNINADAGNIKLTATDVDANKPNVEIKGVSIT
ncbi:hypothetical protein [Candidatus Thioglobus sp.]|uniref:hypothetical protein n=1 Tax=Candidatus Thioglobus sp. TaxID=2026721 RepID=UPI003D0B36D7